MSAESEAGDDIAAGEARQQGSIPDLPGAALGRAVQDRVAVEPDELDRHIGMARAKLSDRGGMQPGQLGLDRGDIPDPAQHRTQPVAERLGIGDCQAETGDDAPAAVGRYRRDIDAVERGAAHQAQRVPPFCAR